MADSEKVKEVIYLGELKYKKKWLGDSISEDDRKMAVLSTVKEAFDSQVYCGVRCNGETCEGKKCPKYRAISIVMIRHRGEDTEETITRSIMIHAYQTGPEGEGVFRRLFSAQGEPIRLILHAHDYNEETKQLKLDCEGFFAQVMNHEQRQDIRRLMKMAVRDESPADAMALYSEDYVDNEQ